MVNFLNTCFGTITLSSNRYDLIEYLQSLALQPDNIWIRALVVRTAQQTIGVQLATQQLRVLRVLQERGWARHQENKRVTVLGVS